MNGPRGGAVDKVQSGRAIRDQSGSTRLTWTAHGFADPVAEPRRSSRHALIPALMLAGLAGCAQPQKVALAPPPPPPVSAPQPAADASAAPPSPIIPVADTQVAPAASAASTIVAQTARLIETQSDSLAQMVAQHRDELARIDGTSSQASQRYFATVAALSGRLQAGSTPGNPALVQQWNAAQGDLESLNDGIGRLGNLSVAVSADADLATYLLNATRAAFGLSGAMEEDHRRLAGLEERLNRANLDIQRLQAQVGDNLNRQSAALVNERANLTGLLAAIRTGGFAGTPARRLAIPSASAAPYGAPSLGEAAPAIAAPREVIAVAPRPPATEAPKPRQPVAIVRFDRPDLAFERALSRVVAKVLRRRPQARFDLVAVTPNEVETTRKGPGINRHTRDVTRVLTRQGVQPRRITVSQTVASGVGDPEVQIYVR